MRQPVTLFDILIGAELAIVAEASDEHSASSFGLPVLLVEGQALGAGDVDRDWGPGVIVVTSDALLAARLRRAGYRTSARPEPIA